jgi:hypothetical protein
LVVAGLGIVSVLVALYITGRNRPSNVEVILGVLGAKVAIVGLVLAIVYHVRVVRRYDRLGRGAGVLVRWRIDGARWRIFRESVVTLEQMPKALPNELKLPAEIPPDGIEVIISADAFCLGPEFEPLEKNAVVRLVGLVLEIHQRVPAGRYSTRLVAYRLPAPENAEADVQRLDQRFTLQATQSRNTVRKAAIVALILAVGALVWIVVWAITVGSKG